MGTPSLWARAVTLPLRRVNRSVGAAMERVKHAEGSSPCDGQGRSVDGAPSQRNAERLAGPGRETPCRTDTTFATVPSTPERSARGAGLDWRRGHEPTLSKAQR